MIKRRLGVTDGSLTLVFPFPKTHPLDPDYQSWAATYPTVAALEAAASSFI